MLVTGDHHLGNTLTGLDHEVPVRKIHEERPEFPAIVRIHSAGRIENSNPVLYSKAATRPHLAFKALWQSNIQACRHKHTLERLQGNRLGYICAQVHPGRQRSGVCRGWKRRFVYDFDFHTFNYYSAASFLSSGRTRFRITPTREARPMPERVNEPTLMMAPPIPIVRMSETMMRLRVEPMSIFA